MEIKLFLLDAALPALIGMVADEQGGEPVHHAHSQTNLKEESV